MDPKHRDYFPFNHPDLMVVDGDVAVCPCKYSSGRYHLCGYADLSNREVPASWLEQVPAAVERTGHGGINYTRRHEGGWVFGFDCGHVGDQLRPELKDPQHVLELARQTRSAILEIIAELPVRFLTVKDGLRLSPAAQDCLVSAYVCRHTGGDWRDGRSRQMVEQLEQDGLVAECQRQEGYYHTLKLTPQGRAIARALLGIGTICDESCEEELYRE